MFSEDRYVLEFSTFNLGAIVNVRVIESDPCSIVISYLPIVFRIYPFSIVSTFAVPKYFNWAFVAPANKIAALSMNSWLFSMLIPSSTDTSK